MYRIAPRRRIGDTVTSIPAHSQGFRDAANDEPRDGTPIRLLVLMVGLAWLAARGFYEVALDVLAWMGA